MSIYSSTYSQGFSGYLVLHGHVSRTTGYMSWRGIDASSICLYEELVCIHLTLILHHWRPQIITLLGSVPIYSLTLWRCSWETNIHTLKSQAVLYSSNPPTPWDLTNNRAELTCHLQLPSCSAFDEEVRCHLPFPSNRWADVLWDWVTALCVQSVRERQHSCLLYMLSHAQDGATAL